MNDIVDSFGSVLDGSAGIIDATIDLLREDEIQSIPFVSIAATVYRIGKTIRERYHLNKPIEFIAEVEAKTIDESKKTGIYHCLAYMREIWKKDGQKNQRCILSASNLMMAWPYHFTKTA